MLKLLGYMKIALTTRPARNGAAVRHKVHKLEVQDLEDQ